MTSYDIEFKPMEEYLIVNVKGRASLESNIDLSKKIVSTAIEMKKFKVLVDIRELKRGTTISEAYILGKKIEPIPYVKKLKTAILHEKERTELESFFENVAVNLGIKLKTFIEEDEAIFWLIDKK
jgi:hypothetical protein